MNKIVRRKRAGIWTSATRTNQASKRPILNRLMGLETEYALRINSEARRAGCAFDFHRFIGSLSNEILVAPSIHNPYRFFLANGGCVSLEHGSSSNLRNALLESATPECTSPKELLCYQIASEQLLSETIESTFVESDTCLIKSSSDAHGHVFGQHESYEVELARGWRLCCWRAGLIFLLPIMLLYRVLAATWLASVWVIACLTAKILSLPRRLSKAMATLGATVGAWLTPQRYTSNRALPESQPSPAENTKRSRTDPILYSIHWIRLSAFGLRVLHAPMASIMWLNIYMFALVPHRRHLSAFFASRCVVDGAGYLDENNRYWLSLRASITNSIIGYGSYRDSRPIFRCDPWLRSLCSGSFLSFRNYARLFNARQRVEIALGDSGLCEQSQFVRLGSTALVLDLVERVTPSYLPRLRDPLGAMTRYARDWMLLATAADRSLKQWTALEVQHAYAAAVRAMLQSSPSVTTEAWKILDEWQTTLNQLRSGDDEQEVPRNMLGRVDWLSKLWLLDQVTSDSSWQVRKKIDIRYHELSSSGYHWKMMEMLQIPPIADAADIERARRLPPLGSPALKRGYLIREFADSEADLHVDWTVGVYYVDGEKRHCHFN